MPGLLPFDTNGSTAKNANNQADSIGKNKWHDLNLSKSCAHQS